MKTRTGVLDCFAVLATDARRDLVVSYIEGETSLGAIRTKRRIVTFGTGGGCVTSAVGGSGNALRMLLGSDEFLGWVLREWEWESSIAELVL